MMIGLKELNEQEITHLNAQIHMLRDSLFQKDEEVKQIREQMEGEFQRKSTKLIEEAKAVKPDDSLEKELEELKNKNNEL